MALDLAALKSIAFHVIKLLTFTEKTQLYDFQNLSVRKLNYDTVFYSTLIEAVVAMSTFACNLFAGFDVAF